MQAHYGGYLPWSQLQAAGRSSNSVSAQPDELGAVDVGVLQCAAEKLSRETDGIVTHDDWSNLRR